MFLFLGEGMLIFAAHLYYSHVIFYLVPVQECLQRSVSFYLVAFVDHADQQEWHDGAPVHDHLSDQS